MTNSKKVYRQVLESVFEEAQGVLGSIMIWQPDPAFSVDDEVENVQEMAQRVLYLLGGDQAIEAADNECESEARREEDCRRNHPHLSPVSSDRAGEYCAVVGRSATERRRVDSRSPGFRVERDTYSNKPIETERHLRQLFVSLGFFGSRVGSQHGSSGLRRSGTVYRPNRLTGSRRIRNCIHKYII